MQRSVVKDIQIKKKVTAKPQVETVNFNNYQSFKKEDAPIYKKEVTETIQTQKHNPEDKIIYSLNTKKSKKGKIIFIILTLLICVFLGILYFFTKVKITITPKITTKDINESITISSWANPLVSTVMLFNEDVSGNVDSLDQAHKEIEEKIKNRFQYDTPVGYIILPGCKTNIYYENGPNIENSSNIKVIGKVAALLIKEDTVYSYLKDSLKLKDVTIKDIFGIRCELKSDITNYTIGQKSENLSFIISGSIKYEAMVNQEEVIGSIKGLWKNEAIRYLNTKEEIMNFILKSKPINSFPLIPKDSKKIEIEIDSILD
jgi:hypothetical protein